MSICNPRKIYQSALLNISSKIIIAHNHPSVEDYKIIKKIKNSGQMIDIQLMNQFIVNTDNYLSVEDFLFYNLCS